MQRLRDRGRVVEGRNINITIVEMTFAIVRMVNPVMASDG
jgi:hypothetical protein